MQNGVIIYLTKCNKAFKLSQLVLTSMSLLSRLTGKNFYLLSPGFEGRLCESNIDNCQPDPCHHGTCIDGIASYTCNCVPGYTGYRCENQLNECHSNPCQNGGKCVDLVNKYICQCQHGTSGTGKHFNLNCIRNKHLDFFDWLADSIENVQCNTFMGSLLIPWIKSYFHFL